MSADRRSSGLLGWQGWAAAAAIAVTPSFARADVGIPMLALAWPAAWLTLPPVVLIEGIAARRILGLPYKDGLLLALRANAWSTVVGIPVAWVVMLGIEMLTGLLLSTLPRTVLSGSVFRILVAPFFAAWVPPTREIWVVPAAGALLCVPFYLLSVRLEAHTAEAYVPKEDALRWARLGNRLTYGVFATCLVASAVVSALRQAQ